MKAKKVKKTIHLLGYGLLLLTYTNDTINLLNHLESKRPILYKIAMKSNSSKEKQATCFHSNISVALLIAPAPSQCKLWFDQ